MTMTSSERHVITGLVGPGGARVFSARSRPGEPMSARIWFALSQWRIDDGDVEHGEFKLMKAGAPAAPNGKAWGTVLREGRVIRVDAWFDSVPHALFSEEGDWHFGDKLELDPSDDPDLSLLGVDVEAVSPPTETWHTQVTQTYAKTSGSAATCKALLDAIELPAGGEWRTGTIWPSTVWFLHETHRPAVSLGQGRPASVRVQANKGEILLSHSFGGVFGPDRSDADIARGNAALLKFLDDVVRPAAVPLGLEFNVEGPGEVIIPDVLRVEPVEITGVGRAHPRYSVLFGEATNEPVITCNQLRTDRFACPLFNGMEVGFQLQRDDTASHKVPQAIRAFLDLEGEALEAARDECNRRLWKLKHKKRREYDPADSAAIDELWSELMIPAYGYFEGTALVVGIHKLGKDWPLQLKLRGGNRVTKFG